MTVRKTNLDVLLLLSSSHPDAYWLDQAERWSSLVLTAIHALTLKVHTHIHTCRTTHPLRVGAIPRGDPTHLTVPKPETLTNRFWELKPAERQTDVRLTVLSKWKSISCYVMFTFHDGYRCNISVVPFSLFSWSHLSWWVVVHLFVVPLVYPLSCRRDLVSQNNSKHLTAYSERLSHLQLKAISALTKILCSSPRLLLLTLLVIYSVWWMSVLFPGFDCQCLVLSWSFSCSGRFKNWPQIRMLSLLHWRGFLTEETCCLKADEDMCSVWGSVSPNVTHI